MSWRESPFNPGYGVPQTYLPPHAYSNVTLPEFPARPSNVKGGQIADLQRRVERARETAGLASGAVNRLYYRQREFEQVVRNAKSDLSLAELAEVAGAKIGIELAEKERAPLAEHMRWAQESEEIAAKNLQTAWVAYRDLVRLLQQQAERRLAPEPNQIETMKRLIGEWPEVPAEEAPAAAE